MMNGLTSHEVIEQAEQLASIAELFFAPLHYTAFFNEKTTVSAPESARRGYKFWSKADRIKEEHFKTTQHPGENPPVRFQLSYAPVSATTSTNTLQLLTTRNQRVYASMFYANALTLKKIAGLLRNAAHLQMQATQSILASMHSLMAGMITFNNFLKLHPDLVIPTPTTGQIHAQELTFEEGMRLEDKRRLKGIYDQHAAHVTQLTPTTLKQTVRDDDNTGHFESVQVSPLLDIDTRTQAQIAEEHRQAQAAAATSQTQQEQQAAALKAAMRTSGASSHTSDGAATSSSGPSASEDDGLDPGISAALRMISQYQSSAKITKIMPTLNASRYSMDSADGSRPRSGSADSVGSVGSTGTLDFSPFDDFATTRHLTRGHQLGLIERVFETSAEGVTLNVQLATLSMLYQEIQQEIDSNFWMRGSKLKNIVALMFLELHEKNNRPAGRDRFVLDSTQPASRRELKRAKRQIKAFNADLRKLTPVYSEFKRWADGHEAELDEAKGAELGDADAPDAGAAGAGEAKAQDKHQDQSWFASVFSSKGQSATTSAASTARAEAHDKDKKKKKKKSRWQRTKDYAAKLAPGSTQSAPAPEVITPRYENITVSQRRILGNANYIERLKAFEGMVAHAKPRSGLLSSLLNTDANVQAFRDSLQSSVDLVKRVIAILASDDDTNAHFDNDDSMQKYHSSSNHHPISREYTDVKIRKKLLVFATLVYLKQDLNHRGIHQLDQYLDDTFSLLHFSYQRPNLDGSHNPIEGAGRMDAVTRISDLDYTYNYLTSQRKYSLDTYHIFAQQIIYPLTDPPSGTSAPEHNADLQVNTSMLVAKASNHHGIGAYNQEYDYCLDELAQVASAVHNQT